MVHERVSPDRREEFIAAVRPNTRFPADAVFWANRLFGGDWAPSDDSRTAIAAAGPAFFAQALAAYAEYGAVYRPLVEDLKRRTGAKGKDLFMPLRAALTGETHGPELARVLALLPPEVARRRLEACC